MPAEDDEVGIYGPWASRGPGHAVELLTDYDGLWWVAGGWVIEAFASPGRRHGDLDISIPRSDVPSFHHHVEGRLHVWQADRGALRPMRQATDPVPETCGNLWLRPSGSEPWQYDVILMTISDGGWTYKRDRRISLPVCSILWSKDGIRYLRPEIQLLHKAPGLRPKDQEDFSACLPLLHDEALVWLRAALDLAHPGHPWIAQLP